MVDVEAVKAAADCRVWCEQVLKIPVLERGADWWVFQFPPWRPESNSRSFKVCRECWHDHVGDRGGDIVKLIQEARGVDFKAALAEAAEFFRVADRPAEPAKRIIKTYDYVDLSGNLVFQVVRYEPKDFRQRRPDPEQPGEWLWSMKGVKKVPYRLPEWAAAEWVILVEGEKDADTVAAMGLPGTTFAQGAGNVSEFDEYGQWFRGKRLVILPDNDDKGRYHAELCAWLFRSEALELRIVPLSKLEKGDVSDWMEKEGGTKDKLLIAIMNARPLEKKGLKKPERQWDEKRPAASVEKRGRGRPKSDYLSMAEAFLAENMTDEGQPLWRYYRGVWYRYDGVAWSALTEDALRSIVMAHIQDVEREEATINARNNILANLHSVKMCALPEWWPMPCWIDRSGESAAGWLATRSRLVNLRNAARDLVGEDVAAEETFRPPTPALFSTFSVGYEFNPDATCPRWDHYLARVQPLEHDRRCLQMLAGLALVPDTSYNVCFFLFGEPGSGKSVFLHVLGHLVGISNVCCVPLKDFSERFATYPLTAKLLNIVGELPTADPRQTMAGAEGMLKDCTSGGLVPVEMKGKDRYEAPVIARCVFAMNTLPHFHDRSGGLWDRLRIIGFEQRIRGSAEDDPHLREKIVDSELPGVLNWALLGLAELQKLRHFPESSVGVALKEEHRDLCDPTAAYLKTHWVRHGGAFVANDSIWEHYRAWCKESGYHERPKGVLVRDVERVFGLKQERPRLDGGKRLRGFVGLSRDPDSIAEEYESERRAV